MCNGLTGQLFELDVLGYCLWICKEYFPYKEAMDKVRMNQPFDPTDPDTEIGNNLHALVALALGLEDWSELALYTAVKSPLDIFHGVDGWFEFRGTVVTFDLTRNDSKDAYKADLIIHEVELEEKYINFLAVKIATMLKG